MMVALACAALFAGSACRRQGADQASADSTGVNGRAPGETTASRPGEVSRSALAVAGIDLGRHVDLDTKQVTERTTSFAPTDTIFASVHTTGTATRAVVTGRWMNQDGAIVDEKTDTVTTTGSARTVFFIARPAGFVAGTYTLHVLVDGSEMKTAEATVAGGRE